ncbi:MAG: HAD family hydrolase [Candidatus Woesearchaeota archaeon]
MTLICFDLDDTLIMSHKAHVDAFNEAFVKSGLGKVKSSRIREYFGMAGYLIVKGVFPKMSDKETRRLSDEHTVLFIEKHIRKVKAVKGAKRMLSVLKKRGYKLALLSNSRRKLIVPALNAAGISEKAFDIIVGRDEVRMPKPCPDEILFSMRKLKEKEAYMVGDTVFDVKAGKLAGARTVAVASGYQGRAELRKENPDYVLNSAAEILRILK